MHRRSSTVWLPLVLALLLASCTKEEPAPSPTTRPTESSTSVSPSPIKTGDYGYDASGVSATLQPKEGAWTLEVANDSGDKIGAPGVYALDASDGHQVDATVKGAKPLEDGESGSYSVNWPAGFDARRAGMIIFMVGEDMYGGFYLQA